MSLSPFWPEQPVEELCQTIVDCVNRTAPTVEGPTPYRMIRTTNVRNGFVDLTDTRFVDEETFRTWTRRQVPEPGDVILTREAPLGDVGLLREGDHAFLGQRLVAYRTDSRKLDNRFLLYYLLSPGGQSQIASFGMGSTVAHMRVPDAKKLRIPTPPLETQRRIAAILGAYDDLIEVNRRRVAVLEEMARGLFEEWFVRFRFPGHEQVPLLDTPHGPLPQGWGWGTLGDYLEERRDKATPGDHLSSRRYVPIECIGRRTFALTEHQPWENAQSSLQLFERGDFLFGAMRAYFHKVAPAPFAGITRTTCFVLRPCSLSSAAYALLALFQDSTVAYAAAKSSGSTIPYAKWSGVLEKMALPRPDEELVSSFNTIVWPMVEMIMNLAETNEALAASRDLLLPRLISGQLSVEAAARQLEDAA